MAEKKPTATEPKTAAAKPAASHGPRSKMGAAKMRTAAMETFPEIRIKDARASDVPSAGNTRHALAITNPPHTAVASR